MNESVESSPQLPAEEHANTMLIDRLSHLSILAGRGRYGNWLLGETWNAFAPLYLVDQLESDVRNHQLDLHDCDIAATVLRTFDLILSALRTYRHAQAIALTGADNVRASIALKLKQLQRKRSADRPELVADLINEPTVGPNLLLELEQTAFDQAVLELKPDGRSAVIRVKEGALDVEPTVTWCSRTADVDPGQFDSLLQETINRLDPDDLEATIRERLRALVRCPTQRKWQSLIELVSLEDRAAQRVAIHVLKVAGRRSGLFPTGLPKGWLKSVSDDTTKIRILCEQIQQFRKAMAKNKAGRPPLPKPLIAFAEAVDRAYFEGTGRHLTLTRPTPTSRAANRGRTTGSGLAVMTYSIQMIQPGLDESRARTLIERLRKSAT